MANPHARSRYIDEWRGVSVLLVIANHLVLYRFAGARNIDAGVSLLSRIHHQAHWLVVNWGTNAGIVGVCIFFVISGYLITHLMQKEEQQTGDVSLSAFYVRRLCRILPALLLYVLGVWILDRVGAIRLDHGEMLESNLFLCNTAFVTCGHHFNQLWSLGVEEQFYLFWPLLFLAAGKARTTWVWIALGASAAVACLPSLRINGWLNNGECFACICAGVLYALSPRARRLFACTRRVPTWAWFLLLAFVIPYARSRWAFLDAPIALALPPVIVSSVLARSGALSPFPAVLSGIGLISYSLYLWQGVFTWKPQAYLADWFAYGSILAIAIAWLSYRFVERPFVKLGHQASGQLKRPESARIVQAH